MADDSTLVDHPESITDHDVYLRVMEASVEVLVDPRFARMLFLGKAGSEHISRALQALQLRGIVESMRSTTATVELAKRANELGNQANRYAHRASWLVAVIAASALFNAWLAGKAAGVW